MTASIHEIKAEGFSAHCDYRGSAVVVWLKGNADMAVHEPLKTFLDAIERVAKSTHTTEAVFELEELYFMNSSCLSLLLRFVNGMMEAERSAPYRVRFRSNPKLRWQKKSLAALRAYAQELVVVE